MASLCCPRQSSLVRFCPACLGVQMASVLIDAGYGSQHCILNTHSLLCMCSSSSSTSSSSSHVCPGRSRTSLAPTSSYANIMTLCRPSDRRWRACRDWQPRGRLQALRVGRPLRCAASRHSCGSARLQRQVSTGSPCLLPPPACCSPLIAGHCPVQPSKLPASSLTQQSPTLTGLQGQLREQQLV